ncbi:MAG: heme lyase CcmF/NrfE family subunit [Gemmatimonadaceae bacterium]|jgi:cytochrome c-type biogenesis protein CcmF|nr:heme lyase CcmF/NrfE family subunit [Gemmatimonadaceae bacterium]
MTRLLGQQGILLALVTACYGIGTAVIGVRKQRRDLVESAFSAVYATFGLLTLATAAMIYGLVTHDFSIGYVAQVGSTKTPTFYTVISLWGALEGSILFWGWVLAMYSAVVVWQNRARPGQLVPYAAAVLLAIGAFFYILMLGPANPFTLVSPAPADGPGPNPLLQNHILMAVHPPLLYLGYVGMAVPFAFAMGALLAGEVDRADWIKLTRRWTISAWAFLSLAIVAGMWWSYEVLGWGGYWAWDPVENASFMPWLTATAYLHSVMVQERRGMLRLWNVNLIAATFLLTILGTFLTRSGIISSVHAFAEGPIGYYFLAFIAIGLVFTVVLVAGNSEKLRSDGALDSTTSRETVFLLNNLFLTAFTFTVVLGTLYPLVAEAIRGVKVSVGAPFFNRMTIPICAALLFLMGVGPALPWRRTSAEVVKKQLLVPGIAGVLAAVGAAVLGARDAYVLATFAFATFALVCNLREYQVGIAARQQAQGESWGTALVRLVGANQRRYGGYVAHMGVVMIAVAIAASSTWKSEKEATLKPGQTMSVAGYTVRLKEVWGREEAQRSVVGADVEVLGKGGQVIGLLEPRMNFYPRSEQPVPTPSVRSRPQGDLYLNLQAFAQDGSTATIRAIVEPLVPWIWVGGFVVFLGSVISTWPTARSARRRTVPAPSAGAVPRPVGASGPLPVPVAVRAERA